MENKELHVFIPGINDENNKDDYFAYIFNPTKEIVYNTIRLLYRNKVDQNTAKVSITTLENFWIPDNSTVHSFIIKKDRTTIGLVVGNIRTVCSGVEPDYNIFVARFMEVDPLYSKHFRKLTSEIIFQMNQKHQIIAVVGTDCGYKNTSNSLGFWVRPLRVKKGQKLGNIKINDTKKYLPKTGYDKTEWILHDGKYNIAEIMNWYLLQKKVTFVKYNPTEATAFLGKNIKVYHDRYFEKIFAFLEQPTEHKSCMVFYMHGVTAEEIAAFLYKTTKYEHMIVVIPGALKKEIVMGIIDDIRENIYVKNAEVLNQILVDYSVDRPNLVPLGSELLSTIF